MGHTTSGPRPSGDPVGQDERLLGSSFGAVAPAYAEHRPDYAQAAARWALDSAPGPRVLDLGAGTGKLTATLITLGAKVVAVEPDPAMLAELRRSLPAIRALGGSAEAVPLPDASVDAVVAEQMPAFTVALAAKRGPCQHAGYLRWRRAGPSRRRLGPADRRDAGAAEWRSEAKVSLTCRLGKSEAPGGRRLLIEGGRAPAGSVGRGSCVLGLLGSC